MKRFQWLVPACCLAVAILGTLGGKIIGEVAFFIAFGAYAWWVVVPLWKGGKERWRTSNLFFLCLFMMFPATLVAVALELSSRASLERALQSWGGILLLALMLGVGALQELHNKRVCLPKAASAGR